MKVIFTIFQFLERHFFATEQPGNGILDIEYRSGRKKEIGFKNGSSCAVSDPNFYFSLPRARWAVMIIAAVSLGSLYA